MVYMYRVIRYLADCSLITLCFIVTLSSLNVLYLNLKMRDRRFDISIIKEIQYKVQYRKCIRSLLHCSSISQRKDATVKWEENNGRILLL